MDDDILTFFLAFLVGFFGGLRALTPPAAMAWAAYLGWLKIARPLSLIGSVPAVAIFSLMAVAELVGDKLAQTPSRTAPPGLIARIVMGALTGACVAASGAQAVFLGSMIGAIGGVVGCFVGYKARTESVKALGTRDLNIALVEDLVAIIGSLWIVSHV